MDDPRILQYLASINPSNASPAERMQAALETLRREQPEQTKRLKTMEPFNWLERNLVYPKEAIAGVFPLAPRRLAFNPSTTSLLSQSELEDVIIHELKHMEQLDQRKGIYENLVQLVANILTPYRDRPEEQEAFGAEEARRIKRNRIQDYLGAK